MEQTALSVCNAGNARIHNTEKDIGIFGDNNRAGNFNGYILEIRQVVSLNSIVLFIVDYVCKFKRRIEAAADLERHKKGF